MRSIPRDTDLTESASLCWEYDDFDIVIFPAGEALSADARLTSSGYWSVLPG